MDTLQLRDEAVRDRVRAAQEFLDPRMSLAHESLFSANRLQLIPDQHEATDQTSY
jgi:hypothetical protein